MSMQQLREFVVAHSRRTACRCGRCVTDGPETLDEPEQSEWKVGALQTHPHTADMVFFEVSAVDDPDPEVFRRLIQENLHGDFGDLDPLDGGEHSYIEVGGWIGDQGLAMQFMALGWLLKLWQCMTPAMLHLPKDLSLQMAGAGYVSIVPHPAGAEIRY